MKNKTSHEILISLSLANLLYLASWRELLYPSTYDYHIKYAADSLNYLSVTLCVMLTGAVLFGVFRVFRHFYGERVKPLVNLTFLLAVLAAINIFRIQFINSSSSAYLGTVFQILVFCALGLTITKWRSAVFSFAKTLVLLLSPFVLITFSQAFWGIVNPPSLEVNEIPVAAQIANIRPNPDPKIKNRVVWIIFDEFDYRVSFEFKPVELPEFERLKNVSLMATNAKSPAWSTLNSIPSLLTGKKVTRSEAVGKSELILNFADDGTGKFSREPNLFFDVAELNGNVTALGWYHPYCRLFGKTLSACKWEGERFSKNLGLAETMLVNMEHLIMQLPAMFSLESTWSVNKFTEETRHVFKESEFNPALVKAAHEQRLAEIRELAADPNTDLAFFHLPVPHAPVQYNRFTKEFTRERQDYINNLALCDSVLGEIRRSLEQAGLWEDTTVIVSSDHQWRINTWRNHVKSAKFSLTDYDLELTRGIEDPRIPFFVKLKNQKESVTYDKPFNTLISRDLIRGIMKGEISSIEELKVRLDAAPDFTPEPDQK